VLDLGRGQDERFERGASALDAHLHLVLIQIRSGRDLPAEPQAGRVDHGRAEPERLLRGEDVVVGAGHGRPAEGGESRGFRCRGGGLDGSSRLSGALERHADGLLVRGVAKARVRAALGQGLHRDRLGRGALRRHGNRQRDLLPVDVDRTEELVLPALSWRQGRRAEVDTRRLRLQTELAAVQVVTVGNPPGGLDPVAHAARRELERLVGLEEISRRNRGPRQQARERAEQGQDRFVHCLIQSR
jgi:hypothetical protein